MGWPVIGSICASCVIVISMISALSSPSISAIASCDSPVYSSISTWSVSSKYALAMPTFLINASWITSPRTEKPSLRVNTYFAYFVACSAPATACDVRGTNSTGVPDCKNTRIRAGLMARTVSRHLVATTLERPSSAARDVLPSKYFCALIRSGAISLSIKSIASSIARDTALLT